MVLGSIYCVHKISVIVAIASHLEDDFLQDLLAIILRKTLVSIPYGPPSPLVRKAAWLTISPLISE